MNNAIFSLGTVIGGLFQRVVRVPRAEFRERSKSPTKRRRYGQAKIQVSKTGRKAQSLTRSPRRGKQFGGHPPSRSANRALRLSQVQYKAAVMRITTKINLALRRGNLYLSAQPQELVHDVTSSRMEPQNHGPRHRRGLHRQSR